MVHEDLGPRQMAILEEIKTSVRQRGYPPSVREIAQAVGLNSSSTVHGHLDRLEQKGYIRRDPTKPRAIEVLDEPQMRPNMVQVPLLGQVAAGQPILAEENIEDTHFLPASLVGSGSLFMLTVRGDSMIGAGILNGDYVIVRQQPTAHNGEIVVALLDNEATVKRFYREADGFRLQPENCAMEPIITQQVTILGKVVGVYRWLS